MIASLLATKLSTPTLPRKRVPRPLLVQRLNDGLAFGRPITLVSAPAGFGKTTLVSEWVKDLADWPVSWLSLDPADDDPGRFFTYLLAALQKGDQNLGQEIEGILRAGQLPPTEIISNTLINGILELKERLLLVLDDLQLIQDPVILQVLETLVMNLPQTLHLVLLTREDPSLPLARLRANNQLTEIRASDLRFTSNQADQFLGEVMGLSLSPTDIDALEGRTEGWVVGLQLAALALQSSLARPSTKTTPTDFIGNLSGSHRFILSYLTEEVLNQQSEEIQRFLLETSILDRLNGDLANAVTGRTDSHLLLEQLLQANLFLLPLDDQQHWYRYHQLFADLLHDLQQTRHREQTAALHQRACQWYTQANMVSEAIQHALNGGDYPTAVHLIENHAMDMLMQWHLKTVKAWVDSIPIEWVAQSVRANLAFAWLHLMQADHARATPYLQRLHTMFADQQRHPQLKTDASLKAKWFALQSMLLNAQGQSEQALQLCNHALEIMPPEDSQVRNMIYLGLANAYQQLDDYDNAVQAFQKLIHFGQAAGNSVTELMGIAGLGLIALQHGQYHFAFEIVSKGISRIERSGSLPPISTAVYGELGVIHYQWHQLEKAHAHFQHSIQVSTLSGFSDAELYYGVILSRLYQIQGDLEAADQEMRKVMDLMQVEAPAAVLEEIITQQVRIYLAQDNLAAAEATLKDQGFSFAGGFSYPSLDAAHTIPMFSKDPVPRSVWMLYISALRILLYRAQNQRELSNLETGIELADQLIAGALQLQYLPFAVETLLLRTQMQLILGNRPAGQSDCLQALALAEPEKMISAFVEEGSAIAQILTSLLERDQLNTVDPAYVKSILEAFPEDGWPSQEELVEPLSKRELEILQLIAEGLSNQEIADRLVVTLHTIKKHSSNIYSKLGVSSRTQAVAQARQLKLL